ncbi:hypothetical protein HK104_000654 [Borealophlyctis nickersoniae]|nr:hypothetical protein HK104_000654 [Borealophlyctis nickersoniae]
MAGTISVEKDWAVVIAGNSEMALTGLNTHLRRVDLLCKLAAPLAVSAVAAVVSVPVTNLFVVGWSLVTIPVEWVLIQQVYRRVPDLAKPKREVEVLATGTSNPTIPSSSPSEFELQESLDSVAPLALNNTPHSEHPTSPPKTILTQWRMFIHHPVFLPALAVSQLYLTVLAFGTVMISYLLLRGYSPALLAGMRSLSVLAGLLATFAMPKMVAKLGLVRTGLWAVWSEVLSLVLVVVAFWMRDNTVFAVLLFGGVTASRFGLWVFDLAETQILQTRVRPDEIGLINGMQYALQNLFELASLLLTMASCPSSSSKQSNESP